MPFSCCAGGGGNAPTEKGFQSLRLLHVLAKLVGLVMGSLVLLFCSHAASFGRSLELTRGISRDGVQHSHETPFSTADMPRLNRQSSPTEQGQGEEFLALEAMDKAEASNASTRKNHSQMVVKFRQLNTDTKKKKRLVELRVEVLGPDGETDEDYSGGVAASLIFVESPASNDAAPPKVEGGASHERAVELASNVAKKGMALLLFSPPADGSYRFSVTCGGCSHRVFTEKRRFFAATDAYLRVVSQPSGAVSGVPLRQQPEVQLMDRKGGALHNKATIVANLVSLNDKSLSLGSWTLEADEKGYARAKSIVIRKSGTHMIRFVTTLWEDIRLEVSSAPFEVVAGPAVAAVFSLKPTPRLLLREPFSVVVALIDAFGNKTASLPRTHAGGQLVDVHIKAYDRVDQEVQLHGQTSRVWSGGHLTFEDLWIPQTGVVVIKARRLRCQQATCAICTEAANDSSTLVHVVSAARLRVHPSALLVETRQTSEEVDILDSDNGGELRISLEADNWRFGAPQYPVSVSVRHIALLRPLEGLDPNDGANFLRVNPTRLLFFPENATESQAFNVQAWSPGVLVGSEELSRSSSNIFIGAFSVELEVTSEDPAWSSDSVTFDIPSPHLVPWSNMTAFQEASSVVIYARDSDTREVLLNFSNQHMVREGEEVKYTMRLSSRPRRGEVVSVGISGSPFYSAQPNMLLFTSANWHLEQTVVLSVHQDDIAPYQEENAVGGLVTWSSIRSLLLQHDVTTSRADSLWHVRGGHEVLLSVWDDDIPGVFWLTDPNTVMYPPIFRVEFRLRSRPLATVNLKLRCEGTEIVGHRQESEKAQGPPVQASLPEEAGHVVIDPVDWKQKHTFILQLRDAEHASITPIGTGTSLPEQANCFDQHLNPCRAKNIALTSLGFDVAFTISLTSKQAAGRQLRDSQKANVPISCLSGQFLWTDNRVVECAPCPAGFECRHASEVPKPCSSGHMSLGGLASCVPCPAGFICPEGTTVPKQLMPGFYRHPPVDNVVPQEGSMDALLCPEGFYCLGGATSPRPCVPGYVSGRGAKECIPCPAGAACKSSRAADVEPCPDGTYSFRGQATCQVCPAGFACASLQKINSSRIRVKTHRGEALGESALTYDWLKEASEGTAAIELLIPCSLGFYSDEADLDCLPCGGTFACPSPKTKEYCFTPYTVALPSDPTACVPCPSRHSCKNGVIERCPDFHYARLGDGLCRLCNGGHLCKGGAEAPDEGELVPVGRSWVPAMRANAQMLVGNIVKQRHNRALQDIFVYRNVLSALPKASVKSRADTRLQGISRPTGRGTCPPGTAHPDNLDSGIGLFSMEAYASCVSCPEGYTCPGGGVPTKELQRQRKAYDVLTMQRLPPGKGELYLYLVHTTRQHKALPQRSQAATCCCLDRQSSGLSAKIFLARLLVVPLLPFLEPPVHTSLLSDCVKCSTSNICPEGSRFQHACPTGWYYDNTGEGKCQICSLGYVCSTGKQVACRVGYYGAFVPEKNSRDCLPCPQGFYCDEEAMTQNTIKPCTAGFTCSTTGLRQPDRKCPAGAYCPKGTAVSTGILCPAGTWSNETGLESALGCRPVRPGTYSFEGATRDNGHGQCEKGYYCPEGSTNPLAVACPTGTYNPDPGGASLDACLPCEGGKDCSVAGLSEPRKCPTSHYCPPGSSKPVPCPRGTYSAVNGLASESECDPCPKGKFCTRGGLTAPAGICEPGFICYEGAVTPKPTDGITGDMCPPGGYCPSGAEEVTPCQAGFYNSRAGAGSASACILCPLGVYCDGRATVHGGMAGPCQEGFYCPEGSTNATAEAAPPGFFAPSGSSSPLMCYPGTYQRDSGSAHCLPCEAGKFCQKLNMTDGTRCPESSYCPEGSVAPKLCPAGTFSSQAGLDSKDDCEACPPERYCGDSGLKAPSGSCHAGYYCGGGSASSAPNDDTAGNQVCAEGYYCPTGSSSPTACPEGTYSPSRQATSIAACLPCDPGMACSSIGSSAPSGICPAGKFCPKGGPISDCPLGHECPVGSAAPIPCRPGTYSDTTDKVHCHECPAGFYCTKADQKPTENEKCPLGFFCPVGTAFAEENPCPQGTLGQKAGATSLKDCEPCPEGMYCTGPGAGNTTGRIAAGYYSSSGAISSKPVHGCKIVAAVAGGQLTACEGFQDSLESFSEAASRCLDIEECKGIEETPEGTFFLRCESNSKAEEQRVNFFHPKHCTIGGVCQPGTYCQEGSAAPVPCPAGEYCAGFAADKTSGACDDGYYCPKGSSSPHHFSALCPPGHYCNKLDGAPVQCPQGKYLSGRGGTSPADCMLCPPGYYCDQPGSFAPTGPCPEGTYCEEGTRDVSGARECTSGHMCPQASPAPIPCPEGTKQRSDRQSTCEVCSPGEVCDGKAVTGKPCLAGFMCPEGTGIATSFPCPPGTYLGGGTRDASTCTPCPEGHFCETAGIAERAAPCQGGYFCPAGTAWREPTTFCKHGEYCPPGSSVPLDCPSNHFCNTVKLIEPAGPCIAGFICTRRSTSPRPSGKTANGSCEENIAGRPCRLGHYCPAPATPLLAGTGFAGNGGEGLPASQSQLMLPANALMDPATHDIYIADYGNYAVKQIASATGLVQKLLPDGSVGGPLGWIRTTGPVGLAFCAKKKTLFISYPGRNAIVEYNVTSRIFRLVDGISAVVLKPLALELDSECTSLYVADSGNHRVLRYTLSNALVETVAGKGIHDCGSVKGGLASSQLSVPSGIALNESDNLLYIADSGNGRVLEINTVDSNAREIAGRGAELAVGDQQGASRVRIDKPVSLALAGETVGLTPHTLLAMLSLNNGTITKVIDFSAWSSVVVEEAKARVAESGFEAAFSGISPFYEGSSTEQPPRRTGVLFADTYMQRLRRVDLSEDLYSRPVVADIPCPAGTYLPYAGAASQAECIQCPPGMYCGKPGLSEPQGPCSTGYYCPKGSEQPTEAECSVGHFCSPHKGPIRFALNPPSKAKMSELPQVTTDLEAASEGGRATSGWFRNTVRSACRTSHPAKQVEGFSGEVKEDVLSLELDKPMDLVEIRIRWRARNRLALLAIEGKTKSSFYTILKTDARERPPRSSILINRRSLLLNGSRNRVFVSPGTEKLRGLQALRLHFTTGASYAVHSVALTTKETMGPIVEQKCPPGSFQPDKGAGSCKTCPAGHYCDGFGLSTSKVCPQGYICPEGSSQAALFHCKLGWISVEGEARNTDVCKPCEKGKFCAKIGATTPTGDCAPGYYCTDGSWTATPLAGIKHPDTGEDTFIGDICPPKTYCPKGASEPTPCPAGTFSEVSGLMSAKSCTRCLPGFACVSEGVQIPCAAGHFCLEGSNTATPTDGKMGNRCPAGSFCPEGSFAPKLCPVGTFSFEGQASCTLCTSGKYCQNPGSTQDGEACLVGHFCPEGTVMPQPCGPGTLQDQSGQASCKPCPHGHYCSTYRLSQFTGKCFSGSMCISEAAHPLIMDRVYNRGRQENGLCPLGHFCEAGALEPTPCPKGQYQDKPGQANCLSCPRGKYCAGTGNTKPTGDCSAGFICEGGSSTPTPVDGMGKACPKGWFCKSGATHPAPCLPGTYTSASGQSVCEQCPEGFYCDEAGEEPKRCPPGKTCPAGSAKPSLCPLGSVAVIKDDAAHSCVPCPYGKYCRGGVEAGKCLPGFLCGLGNWVPNPSTEQANNEPFVLSNALSAGKAVILSAENWDTVGQNGYGGIPCPAGHYCPEGSVKPIPCPSGSVRQNTLGRWESDCSICPAGFYCPYLSLVPEACPEGHFCPVGSSEPRRCLAGTFNPHKEGADTSACLLCFQGYLCSLEGIGDLGPEHQCPTGHYCLEGSQKPIPCPPGTFTDKRGMASESQCMPCPAGTYCTSEGLSEAGDQCPQGYFCPSGTAVPRKCLQGTWCPDGSGEPIQCPPGAFCPPGSTFPQPCPSGSYCPPDASHPIQCPAGYKGTRDRSDVTSLKSGCTICPEGTYTSEPGMTECLKCTPGYVCLEGCNSALPTSKERDRGYRCSPGRYCPLGSVEEKLCPPGTYGLHAAASSLEACYPCTKGMYNSLEGQTGCLLCGSTATSDTQASSCYCKGTNRSFQQADGSCVCLTGFHYSHGSQDLSDFDGKEPCQQTVYEECDENASRDATGGCTLTKSTCIDQCGLAGGFFSPVSGLCSCFGEKTLTEICDESCRFSLPQLLLKDSQLIIQNPNPITSDSVFSLEDLTSRYGLATGSYECLAANGCSVQMFDTTLAKMTGLLGVSQSFVVDLNERLQDADHSDMDSGNSPVNLPPRRLSSMNNFGYFGVSNPVLCLPLGSTVAWHVRPSPNPLYPVYLRSNLLNTNQHFDYGAFRELGSELQAGEQLILFLFTFKDAGLYVFGLNNDSNKLLVLRIMESNKLCRPSALFPQQRTPETLAAVSARLPTTVKESVGSAVVMILLAFVVVLGLLLVALWTFARQRLEHLNTKSIAPMTDSPGKRFVAFNPLFSTARCQGTLLCLQIYHCMSCLIRSTLSRNDMADLLTQAQPAIFLSEDPAVTSSRRALARQIEAQDPRLFTAVATVAKQIQQETAKQCSIMMSESTKNLTKLLEALRRLTQDFLRRLQKATNAEAWLKVYDEERDELMSSLLSLLSLKRKDLVNNLATAAKEKEEDVNRVLLLEDDQGMWTQNNNCSRAELPPPIGEKWQTHVEMREESAEQKLESLIDDFTRAREDADGDLVGTLELCEAKFRSFVHAVSYYIKTEKVKHKSAFLKLELAKARLAKCEEDAQEERTIFSFCVMSSAARKVKAYTATVIKALASSTQSVHKAVSNSMAAIVTHHDDAELEATTLKATILSTVKKGQVQLRAAALEAQDVIAKAMSAVDAGLRSWAGKYQERLLDLHEEVLKRQNSALIDEFSSECGLLCSCMQATRSRILSQIRNRYRKLAWRRADLLGEMSLLIKASVSAQGREKLQAVTDQATETISTQVRHQCDLELASSASHLDRLANSRKECLKNRQNAFRSRKCLFLRRRQEAAAKEMDAQAQATRALLCRGLHILSEWQKVRRPYFQSCVLKELVRRNPEDLHSADALRESLALQQTATFRAQREQFLSKLRSERQAAADEVWELDSKARRRIREELVEVSDELRRVTDKLDQAMAMEESIRNEYDNALLHSKLLNVEGLKELEIRKALAAFKQKLLSGAEEMLLIRAAEVRRLPTDEWCTRANELEPFFLQEKERQYQAASTIIKDRKDTEIRLLIKSQERRQDQFALLRSLMNSEERLDDDIHRKRAEFGMSEIHRIIWRFCTPDFVGGFTGAVNDEGFDVFVGTADSKNDETVNNLKANLRLRWDRHFEYFRAHRKILESTSRSAHEALQNQTDQWITEYDGASVSLSRVSALLDTGEASEKTLAIFASAHQRFEEALKQMQTEYEEGERREELEREKEKVARQTAHDLAKKKLNEEHYAKLAHAEDEDKEQLIQAEHERVLSRMEAELAEDKKEQEARAQHRLLERQERLRRKQQEAEYKKQKELQDAKDRLEAELKAEGEQKEHAADREELQRLVQKGTDTHAIIELARRVHDRESSDLQLELSLKKAQRISDRSEQFWQQRGGRWYAAFYPRISSTQRGAKISSQILCPVQQMDEQNTVLLEDLRKQQAAEVKEMLEQMDCRARLQQECEMQQLSEQGQRKPPTTKVEAGARHKAGLLENHMLGQQQFPAETEEKRQALDKWLHQMRQREEAEEHRRVAREARAALQQRGRQWREDELEDLFEQYESDRQLLEEALVLEAERQHTLCRRKKLLRNAGRCDGLQQKRLFEKQKFLANQRKIAGREAAPRKLSLKAMLCTAACPLRRERVRVYGLLRRAELTDRLEVERHWPPTWRQILEEELKAGTFGSWEPDAPQITFAGSVATTLLHTESMLQKKAGHIHDTLNKLTQLKKLLSVVKADTVQHGSLDENGRMPDRRPSLCMSSPTAESEVSSTDGSECSSQTNETGPSESQLEALLSHGSSRSFDSAASMSESESAPEDMRSPTEVESSESQTDSSNVDTI
ncbi:hypothetical protein Efla_004403 [Eimeria flavescens]